LLMSGIRQIQYADLQFHELLGAGSKGSVYRATWKSENRQVAVKKLLELDQTEAALLNRNIIQLLGASLQRPNQCIVSELAQGGSLYDYLHDSGRDLGPDRLLNWPLRLPAEFATCMMRRRSSHWISSRRNVVLTADFSVCKLCDFGAARGGAGQLRGHPGRHPRWMAVEMLRGDRSGVKPCDAWSYGVVLWELLTRQVPFGVCSRCSAPTGLSLLLGEVLVGGTRPSGPTFGSIVSRLEGSWPTRDTRASAEGQFRPTARGLGRLAGRGPGADAPHGRRLCAPSAAAGRRAAVPAHQRKLAGQPAAAAASQRPSKRPADWRARRTSATGWPAGSAAAGDLAQYGRVMLEHGVDGAAFMGADRPGPAGQWASSWAPPSRRRRFVSVGGAAESPGFAAGCRASFRQFGAEASSVHRGLCCATRAQSGCPARAILLLGPANYLDPRLSRTFRTARPEPSGAHARARQVPCSFLFGNSILCAAACCRPQPDGSACAFVMPDWGIASPAPRRRCPPACRVEFLRALAARLVGAKPSHCSLPLPGLCGVKQLGGIENARCAQPRQPRRLARPLSRPLVLQRLYRNEEAVSGTRALEAASASAVHQRHHRVCRGISLLSEQQRLHPALEPERAAPPSPRSVSAPRPLLTRSSRPRLLDSPPNSSSNGFVVKRPWRRRRCSCSCRMPDAWAVFDAAPATIRWRRRGDLFSGRSAVGGGSLRARHSARKSVPPAAAGGTALQAARPHGRYPAHRRGAGHPQHRGGAEGGGSAAWWQQR
uniref:Protein kinase domain-containing protein n=1 Tax=Macrostomum lignano TaxID=282301 RepID=A0A1I8F922_9PLAT